jgi:hypothetical protein
MNATGFYGGKGNSSSGGLPQDQRPVTPSAPAALPRLFLWKRDLCAILGVGIRTLERMISSGEVPAPDRRLRGRPAWLSRTIYEWAESVPRDGQKTP